MIRSRVAPLVVAAALLAAPAAQAVELEGVEFPERHQSNGAPMQLAGVGLLRYRVLFKGYVAAFYLGDGVASDRALDDVPRRLEIEYFWSIEADDFAEATVEGIRRNVDAGKLARLRDSIDRINALYDDVEPGDRYALTYVPGHGTELALNGEPVGIIEGAEFSAALFSIWLGAEPLDSGLRRDLLTGR